MTKYKYFTEQDLYAAGQLSKHKDFSMIPSASELKGWHIFSEAFERRIAEIYKIFDQPTKKSKIVRKVLLVAAIITILLALAMSASAVCERVYELYLDHFDDYASGIFVSIQQDDGSYIEVRGDLSILYCPSHIPSGFNKVDSFADGWTINYIIFENADGETITFKQEVLCTYLYIDTEATETIEVIENGISYYASSKDGFTTIIWNQDGYSFTISCELTIDEAMEIAKSLLVQ